MRPCGWTVLDARIDRRWEHSEVNPWPDTAATASSSSAGRHELPARRAAGDARVRRTAGRDLARRHSSGWIREGEPDCGRACLRTAIHLSGHGRQQRSVRSVARAADHPTRSRQQHRARPDHRIPWIRRLHEVSQFPVRTGSRNRIARRFGSPCRRVRAEPIVGFPNDVEGDASRPGQVDTAEGAGCGRLPWLRNLVAAPPPAGYVRSWRAVSCGRCLRGCSRRGRCAIRARRRPSAGRQDVDLPNGWSRPFRTAQHPACGFARLWFSRRPNPSGLYCAMARITIAGPRQRG